MSDINHFKQAFIEPANLIGLAGLTAVSAAELTPVPFLAALVLEAAYMLFVPDSPWYRKRIESRTAMTQELKKEEEREHLLPQLEEAARNRYLRMHRVRVELVSADENHEGWEMELGSKLDHLLDKFLHFARNEAQYSLYLDRLTQEQEESSPSGSASGLDFVITDSRQRTKTQGKSAGRSSGSQSSRTQDQVERLQATYQSEIDGLKSEIGEEKDETTQAVLQKRIDVLERRSEFVGKIGRIIINLHHQLQLLEDLFGLVSDQVRVRTPEQILLDVDEVVCQTDTMSQALEELAPYEQMLARLGVNG